MKKIIAIAGFFGVFASSAVFTSAGYFNTTPLNRCDTQITQTLQRGSQNNEVYILQNMLNASGYLQAQPNGYFGYQTQYAVRVFQANNGISQTGTVGPATRNAINERLCDRDLIGNAGYGYDNYGYGNGVTYVGQNDPYVRVISPQVTTPAVYATPQSAVSTVNPVYNSPLTGVILPVQNNIQPLQNNTVIIPPATTINSVSGTGIVYNPASGYSYGITPQTGSITVTSPVANTTYQEGDTVFVNWSTDNLSVTAYQILLESEISRQSKVVNTVSGNSFSFVLTKELLDSVCSGACNNSQNGSFRIVVSTPSLDIAGNTSNLRAAVAPITIKRPLGLGQVNISASKTPVNSGEIFKLFINVPTDTLQNNNALSNYSIRVSAICPVGVTATVAGHACGQEFVMPFMSNNTQQQEIPAGINNPTWYKQEVTFRVTVVNLFGQVIGTADTKVIANGTSFNW